MMKYTVCFDASCVTADFCTVASEQEMCHMKKRAFKEKYDIVWCSLISVCVCVCVPTDVLYLGGLGSITMRKSCVLQRCFFSL